MEAAGYRLELDIERYHFEIDGGTGRAIPNAWDANWLGVRGTSTGNHHRDGLALARS